MQQKKNDKTVLLGCTPGDDLIISQLSIANETIIDFIKWDLTLDNSNHNTFMLNIVYGESQPNTLGFNGEKGNRIKVNTIFPKIMAMKFTS